MRVILMQGLPGAGKSTWIRNHAQATLVVSADDLPGLYPSPGVIDPKLLPKAHAWCLRRFAGALDRGDAADREDVVVVDNTNLTLVELAPYVALARAFGVEPEIVRIVVPAGEALARNTHGVPAHLGERMAAALEKCRADWPPFWPSPRNVHVALP
jgi:predicted kinase